MNPRHVYLLTVLLLIFLTFCNRSTPDRSAAITPDDAVSRLHEGRVSLEPKATDLVLARNGAASFDLSTDYSAGAVASNAIQLLREELNELHGVTFSAASAENRIVIKQPVPVSGQDDQVYDIQTSRNGYAFTITLSGTGERGILYGVCEILDLVYTEDHQLKLPVLNVRSGPDIKKRGTERHWFPTLTTPEGVEENIKLIRMLARKRVNTLLWNDCWIAHGDGNWFKFLEFRYYPALQREDPDGKIREAKDCMNRVIEAANSWGMEFYLSTTEFLVPASLYDASPELFYPVAQNSLWPRIEPGTRIKVPLHHISHRQERKLNFALRLDKQGTWDFYKAKIREAMEDFPGLAGIELWTGEAMDIWWCYTPPDDTRSLGDWLQYMYGQTLEAMDDAGRPDAELICRSFTHHPLREIAWEELCGELPDRCQGLHKSHVEDFYRYDSPTTLANRLTPGRGWVEFDAGGEYRGDWSGWICTHLNYLQEFMRVNYDKGVRRFVTRVRGWTNGPGANFAGDAFALNSVESLKYDVFFQNCWNMDRPQKEIWQRWNRRKGYPEAMFEFFKLSEQVSDRTMYINKAIINNQHSRFMASVYDFEWRITFPFQHAYNEKPVDNLWILEPKEENIAKMRSEKEEALNMAMEMQDILDSCKDQLPDEDYQILQRTIDYEIRYIRVMREQVAMYFRFRMLLGAGNERLPQLTENLNESMERCKTEIAGLEEVDPRMANNARSLIEDVAYHRDLRLNQPRGNFTRGVLFEGTSIN